MAVPIHDDLLSAAFSQQRDVETSYKAYRRFWRFGRDEDLETAFRLAIPVVRDVCFERDRSLVAAAAWDVFRALRRRGFKRGGPGLYWIYLRHIAFGAVANGLRQRTEFLYETRIDQLPSYSDTYGRLIDYADVDQKLIIEKLPVLVAERVTARLRFDGEDRAACLYVLRCLIEGFTPPVRGIAKFFALSQQRLRFLVDYVTTRVRAALRAVRAELVAAGGTTVGWLGNISVHRWLYGENDDATGIRFAN